MEVISAREFRTNQSKYLGMVKRGEEVILKSRDLGSFHIRPITTQEVVVNKTDLTESLRMALLEVKLMNEGKIKELSMTELLDELSSYPYSYICQELKDFSKASQVDER